MFQGLETVVADQKFVPPVSMERDPSGQVKVTQADSWLVEVTQADSWLVEVSQADSWLVEVTQADSWLVEVSQADSWLVISQDCSQIHAQGDDIEHDKAACDMCFEWN